jgi:hypothetical protein
MTETRILEDELKEVRELLALIKHRFHAPIYQVNV